VLTGAGGALKSAVLLPFYRAVRIGSVASLCVGAEQDGGPPRPLHDVVPAHATVVPRTRVVGIVAERGWSIGCFGASQS
jgi:hypothetical protein